MLSQGDPLADDPGISDQQRAAMRRATLVEVSESAAPFWRQLAPALSTAALLAVALGVTWWPAALERPPAPPILEEGAATVDSEERRIQFETPGGTLVVWILNSDFPSRELQRSEKTRT
jgi:hypothetical protein